MTNNSQRTLKLRTVTADNPLKVCFVCLGNICRSPTAEGVFEHLVKREGLLPYFEIDSAGTGAWHVGERANSRSRKVAEQNGVQLNSLARKFERSDLEEFDLVIAMDKENLHDLRQLDARGSRHNRLFLLREFDPVPGNLEVPDPYYGGMDGFELVFEMVVRSCEHLLDQIRPHIKDSA